MRLIRIIQASQYCYLLRQFLKLILEAGRITGLAEVAAHDPRSLHVGRELHVGVAGHLSGLHRVVSSVIVCRVSVDCQKTRDGRSEGIDSIQSPRPGSS
jgi:hypothetical protein